MKRISSIVYIVILAVAVAPLHAAVLSPLWN